MQCQVERTFIVAEDNNNVFLFLKENCFNINSYLVIPSVLLKVTLNKNWILIGRLSCS